MSDVVSTRERRGAPRHAATSPVRIDCRRRGDPPGATLALEVLDFSRSGLRLVLNGPVLPGDVLQFGSGDFGAAGAETILGVVCWYSRRSDGTWVAGIELDSPVGEKASPALNLAG